MEKQIILNQICTPDGTGLMSLHRYDYKEHLDKNGFYYAVDGGNWYLKRNMGNWDYTELTIYSDAPFIIIRECMHWGTYGKSGKEELKWILLKDMESEHIKNIIVTEKQIIEAKALLLPGIPTNSL